MSEAAETKIDYKALIKFDKTKPHGVVFPPYNGAHYDQDGFHFDQSGDLLDDPEFLTPALEHRLRNMAAKKEADRAAEAARQAAYKKMGVDGAKVEKIAAPTPAPADAGEIDLVRWALGQGAPIPWPKVRAAAEAKFSVSVMSADQLREWMRDQGMIGKE